MALTPSSLSLMNDSNLLPIKEPRRLSPPSSARLYYWIEVGRNKDFAREHPEWMASLGSHDDWRNSFPDAPRLNKGEVAKAWPWTPIAYQKAFDAHLARIKELLGRSSKGLSRASTK